MPEYIVQIDKSERNFDEHFVGVLRTYPELIRCKDCIYAADEYNDGECYCGHDRYLIYIKDWDHYCAWAVRKQEDSI